eukprot:429186-Rhodomonas_salina.1
MRSMVLVSAHKKGDVPHSIVYNIAPPDHTSTCARLARHPSEVARHPSEGVAGHRVCGVGFRGLARHGADVLHGIECELRGGRHEERG